MYKLDILQKLVFPLVGWSQINIQMRREQECSREKILNLQF